MNTGPWIVPLIDIPESAIPQWEQFPLECQSELIQALAALLLRLPPHAALEEETSHERQS